MADSNRTLDEWLSFINTQHHKDIALGLDRSIEVAERMQVLPLAPRVLIVAGTNGKGSTVRFAETLLRAQGYRTGAILSPHLHRYNERVRVNGAEATDEQLVAAFEAVDDARGDIPLTYYEYSVLGAFWLFHQLELDVCVLEVGLGGRLDVTNIVDAQVAAVTSIGLDHQNFLGDTVELIGAEKAAVCRPGCPLLLGGPMPDSVLAVAQTTGAVVERFGEHFWFQRSVLGNSVRLDAGELAIHYKGTPRVALRNVALASACVQKLTRTPTQAELTQACKDTRHPGRFEIFTFQDRPLVLDLAHNPPSARFLRAQLQARWPGRRWVMCCGFLEDKDVAGIVQELRSCVDHWVFTKTSGPRGLSAEDAAVRAQAGQFLVKGREFKFSLAQDAKSALEKTRALTGKADIMVAFGSFLQVQRVRELLPNQAQF